MTRHRARSAWAPWWAWLACAWAAPCGAREPDRDVATELAARIDARLEARWSESQIEPAPRAEDAEFLRRASLDLTGRIPRAADVYEFLADPSPTKRRALIDRLLNDPRFAIHFGNLWRAELLPEAGADPQAAALERGLENWLVQAFRSGERYDRLVRSLVTVPLPAVGSDAEPVLRDPERPNPLAFIAGKGAQPEKIAAAVTRTFLGVRLECAECHDHPFADWTQGQFWSQAAFFAGVSKQGNGAFAPLAENVALREISPPHDGMPKSQAEFLDGTTPAWSAGRSPRVDLAEWITSPHNPYFARTAVNRLWAQFFGVGLVEPVDDFRGGNPPSDPLLLDELATTFVRSDFDLTTMIRALCLTDAYQRTSARTHPSQDATPLPARMVAKALTGEQFFDSLAVATGYRDDQDRQAARRQFESRFDLLGSWSEPETSVQQALTLLNGRFVAWATDPERCPTLIAATQTPHLTTAQRIESLYAATLSRRPTPTELERLESYVHAVAADDQAEPLADVYWMLLNTGEFRLNH